MRLARQLHLYSGVFFAPAIIFLALTGLMQTFSLHEEHDGVKPERWIAVLADVHKHQRMPAPPRPAAGTTLATPPPAATPAAPAAGSATPAVPGAGSATPAAPAAGSATQNAAPAPRPRRKSSFPLQVFMGFLAVSLIGSTLVGIWMSFQLNRSPRLILALLFAGAIIPIVGFYVGVQ